MALTFGRSTEPGDQWRDSADTHFEHHRVGADSIACLQAKTRAAFGHDMEGVQQRYPRFYYGKQCEATADASS